MRNDGQMLWSIQNWCYSENADGSLDAPLVTTLEAHHELCKNWNEDAIRGTLSA